MLLDESIIVGLSSFGEMGNHLKEIISTGVISSLDTQMIIDQSDFHAIQQGNVLPLDTQKPFTDIEAKIEAIQEVILEEGLGNNNFHVLVGEFGRLLFSFIASDSQIAEVAAWHEQGIAKFGGFLMADGGGPSIQQWNTVFTKNGEMLELNVDKVWIIEGHRLDYGSIASASTQRLYPNPILVPPQEFKKLQRTAVGMPFLDGSLQLGNISGNIQVHNSNMLTRGGLASISVFLSKVRPRFVRALMGHIQALQKKGRVTLSPKQLDGVRQLEIISKSYYYSLIERKPSLLIALAIKFVSNRLLLDIVISSAVKEPMVQRDLMAFTRMEGSSYRCLLEMYNKLKIQK